MGNVLCNIEGKLIYIKDVYYMPNMKRNYLSVTALTGRDNKVIMSENTFEIFFCVH